LEGVSPNKLRTRPLLEVNAMRRLRAGQDAQTTLFERNAAFQQEIPVRELVRSDVIVGFDTSSWVLAERACALGRSFVLDQSIAHPLTYQRVLPRLADQFPEWAEAGTTRLPQLLSAEQAEHRQAHRVVVASSFTHRTLVENGVVPEKIVINPYGVDLNEFSPRPGPRPPRPLRFLFVGLLGARKGVPLLLQAWQSLPTTDAELWLAGPLASSHARLVPQLRGLRLVGKVPHRELPELLRQCDVLVFPSYFEGFGLVLLEALAAGLPIIATEATAAPDLINDSIEGLIVPTGDPEALREALLRLITSPDDLAAMSLAARRCAERYTWEAYGNRWVELLAQVA
jgi:glycosyltransferase involved in cell wall biosynthesis